MSSYRNQISCCVTDKVAADLSAAATERELTIAALVRQAIVHEIYFRKDPLPEMHKHMTFVAFAMDELLRIEPDPEIRNRVHKRWRDRIAEQDNRHGD